ncbi:MAG: hypothetical protein DRQ51_09855 [Gammaproteobacteria bacterium]|nr:MAG: hypothetical protein DRQ51_09855 [Gammaproteobacteria bacterium]
MFIFGLIIAIALAPSTFGISIIVFIYFWITESHIGDSDDEKFDVKTTKKVIKSIKKQATDSSKKFQEKLERLNKQYEEDFKKPEKQTKTSKIKYISHKAHTEKNKELIELKNNPQYPESLDKTIENNKHNYDLWYELDRGKAVLQNNKQLQQYFFSYGNMHNKKLSVVYNRLFDNLDINTLCKNCNVEIIDYGCGQGIGSIKLLNYLQEKNIPVEKISQITLIEPSEIALNKAVSFLEKTSNIKTLNKKLDDLNDDDLNTNNSAIKFHIFSNILDMGTTYFNIKNLTSKIKNSQKGINYFICISALDKEKLDLFMSYFYGKENVIEFDGEFKNDKNWKIIFNIFKVNFNNSTNNDDIPF